MPYRVPSGQADSDFIARVRRALRDQPIWFKDPFTTDGVLGSVTAAGSTPFRLKRSPIVAAGVQVSLNGVGQTVVYNSAPGAAPQVGVNTDTGEFYWQNAPGSGQSILTTYQAFRYGDQQVLDALKDGLAEMYPEVWMPATDTSIAFTPSYTEYQLPAQFNDPRVQILSLEILPPSGILVAIATGRYRRQGLTNLIITRGWPAGSTVRITYNAPYVNLADLEQQLVQLPVYYACYKILMDQETMFSRTNDLAQQTAEGAAKPEQSSATAQLWLDRFNALRNRLAVQGPTRSLNPDRSVEMLEAGTGFSWNPL